MNVNSEQFKYNADVDRQRSSFPFKSTHHTTLNAGGLYPIYCQDVLPGDTFSGDVLSTIRMSSPLFPTMDDAYVDTWAFFVPARLCWNRAKEFFGENTRSNWTYGRNEMSWPHVVWSGQQNATTVTDEETGEVKYLKFNNPTVSPEGSLMDYFGLPIYNMHDYRANGETALYDKTNTFDMLPFEAYNLIWNNFFRDQNSMQPCPLKLQNTSYTDAHAVDGYYLETKDVSYDHPENTGIYYATPDYLSVKPVCKFHDAFTSALPQAQKGLPVPLPGFGEDWKFPIVSGPQHLDNVHLDGYLPMKWTNVNVTPGKSKNMQIFTAADGSSILGAGSDSSTTTYDTTPLPSNMWAHMIADTLPSINDLRYAFAVQRILEADARGGSLYGDLIYAHFGVENPDARMQLPEYLGGSRQLINMQQVAQTSETGMTPQGNVSGLSLTNSKNCSFTKSFTEHGYVIVLAAIRTNQTYQSGIERRWSKRDKYDIYTPELACVGEMPIRNKELCCGAAVPILAYEYDAVDDNKAFGFNEAWYWYRYANSNVSGKMRSFTQDSLDAYHYGQYYHVPESETSEEIYPVDIIYPTLSQSFLTQSLSPVDRSLTFDHALEPQFICEFLFDFNVSRCMPVHSIPGLVDHY